RWSRSKTSPSAKRKRARCRPRPSRSSKARKISRRRPTTPSSSRPRRPTATKTMNRKRSAELFAASKRVIAGGVNSPVRAFRGVGGAPVFFARAEGARVWDVDGNEYVDYVGSWGPMILGHAHPEILDALREAAAGGTSFGAPTEREFLFAEAIARA